MANIAVTAFCNLRCPYCFADEMINEQTANITLERYHEILDWLSRTPENHVGIIGGEPTIHPQFDKILEETNRYCREVNTSATLFTNGIMLDKFVDKIGNAIGILINCNHPDGMTADQWRQFCNTMEHLHLLDWFHPGRERANIGCNLYAERTDYDYIWAIIDKYNIKRLRVSVTAPITDEHRHNKEKYFEDMKPIFMDFVDKATERQIILGKDCSQIPDCYFTRQEMDRILKVMPDKMEPHFCEPVIDITPQFTATACFGCYSPVDCREFPTVIDLRRWLLHNRSFPRMRENATGRCKKCKQHELMMCEGGCLGFSPVDDSKLKQIGDGKPLGSYDAPAVVQAEVLPAEDGSCECGCCDPNATNPKVNNEIDLLSLKTTKGRVEQAACSHPVTESCDESTCASCGGCASATEGGDPQ